jgi:hypothetical protein
MNLALKRGLFPVGAGLLGTVLLAGVYLGIVSLAQSPAQALELFWQDKALVIPILLGFGTQVGLYLLLKKGRYMPVSVTGGATTAAGGGVSTVAMVACCANRVADVLPLVGLTAAAAFLAQWKIPFMVAGLLTNVLGIGVMLRTILKERLRALSQPSAPAMENLT